MNTIPGSILKNALSQFPIKPAYLMTQERINGSWEKINTGKYILNANTAIYLEGRDGKLLIGTRDKCIALDYDAEFSQKAVCYQVIKNIANVNNTLSLSTDNGQLIIKGDDTRYTLKSLDETVNLVPDNTIDTKTLKRYIPFLSDDKNRETLTKIWKRDEGLASGNGVMALIDRSYLVSEITKSPITTIDKTGKVTIPENTSFPDYGHVIPECKLRRVVDKKDLLDALKSFKKCSTVKIDCQDDMMTISGKDEELERYVSCSGDDFTVWVNPVYLKTCVNAMAGDYIVMALKSPTCPVILNGDDDTIALLMPMN